MPILRETLCHFYVDGRTILARWVDTRHPEMLDFPREAHEISGAALWGTLRDRIVDRFLLTFDGPNRVNIVLDIQARITWAQRIAWREYFSISWNEYMDFVEEYCDDLHEEDTIVGKVDWKREGF
jgi:hypothetical protein